MSINIDRGIPAPKRNARTVYPFADMSVGDSFFVSGDLAERVVSAASYRGSRNNEKYSVRKVEGGKRVWRIA